MGNRTLEGFVDGMAITFVVLVMITVVVACSIAFFKMIGLWFIFVAGVILFGGVVGMVLEWRKGKKSNKDK